MQEQQIAETRKAGKLDYPDVLDQIQKTRKEFDKEKKCVEEEGKQR